jgi:hypothetical protein
MNQGAFLMRGLEKVRAEFSRTTDGVDRRDKKEQQIWKQ